MSAAFRRAVARVGRQRPHRLLSVALLGALAATGLTACGPDTPAAQQVVGGLEFPASFTIDPNGVDLWYTERFTGEVRRYNQNTQANTLVDTIPNVTTAGREQGTFGIAVHPNYPTTRLVFVLATVIVSGAAREQIFRISIGANGLATGRTVIFDIPAATQHVGGRLQFGPGGFLFAAIGDHLVHANAQNLSNAVKPGKIHRITTDGGAPAGNPIAGNTLWAYGVRNSFGFNFDPSNQNLWFTDNGPTCNDEVNLLSVGGNHGWGPNGESCEPGIWETTNEDGPTPRVRPKVLYNPTTAPTGAAFCSNCGLRAEENGTLLVGNANNGHIRRLILNSSRNAVTREQLLVDHAGGVFSVESRPGGPVYFSDATAIYKLVLV
jgi:glucose/arabinose dehydrogenase